MVMFASSLSGSGYGGLLLFLIVIAILTAIVGILLTPVLLVTAILRKQALSFLHARENVVIAQYDPPRNLSPAQIGLLYDLKCDDKEIRATLFDLEQRKVIQIDSDKAVQIVEAEAFERLEEYEKIAVRLFDRHATDLEPQRTITITGITAEGPKNILVPIPLAKNKTLFTAAVQSSLASQGIRMKGYTTTIISRTVILATLIGLWPLITAGIAGTTNGESYTAWSLQAFFAAFWFTFVIGFFAWPIYILVAYVLLRLFTAIAGRVWLSNKSVRQLWPELEGYKLFLQTVDIDNIQFESENAEEGIVTKTLPYAMVFNLDTKWQSRLTKIK